VALNLKVSSLYKWKRTFGSGGGIYRLTMTRVLMNINAWYPTKLRKTKEFTSQKENNKE